MLVETCDIDAFLDQRWTTVDEIRDTNAIRDTLDSPSFDTYEGLVLRVGKHMFVYYREEFLSVSRAMIQTCTWSDDDNVREFTHGKSWLDAWRLCNYAPWMAYAICQDLPKFRAVEISLTMIHESIRSKGMWLQSSYDRSIEDLRKFVSTKGTHKVEGYEFNDEYSYRDDETSYRDMDKVNLNRALTMCCYIARGQLNFYRGIPTEISPDRLRALLPMREVLGLLFP